MGLRRTHSERKNRMLLAGVLFSADRPQVGNGKGRSPARITVGSISPGQSRNAGCASRKGLPLSRWGFAHFPSLAILPNSKQLFSKQGPPTGGICSPRGDVSHANYRA